MKLYFAALFSLCFGNSYAQLECYTGSVGFIVTPSFLGPDYTISNLNYVGHPQAVGSFIGDSCNLGLSKGIVMTNGLLYTNVGPQGPNNNSSMGSDNGFPGDSVLNNSTGLITYNASVLEFDIVSLIDSVKFKYVFGSEEYPEYVGAGFNDQMRIYISGPGIVGVQNMAYLPFGEGVGIETINAGSNAAFFINNGDGSSAPQDSSEYFIQYDGFTKPLLAAAVVQPGLTYHLRIAIADAGDAILDSGIFIEQCESCDFNAGLAFVLAENIKYYPNPSNGKVTLEFPALPNTMELEVIDMIGELIRIELLASGSTSFVLSDLETGSYILRIQDVNVQWQEKLVVLKK